MPYRNVIDAGMSDLFGIYQFSRPGGATKKL